MAEFVGSVNDQTTVYCFMQFIYVPGAQKLSAKWFVYQNKEKRFFDNMDNLALLSVRLPVYILYTIINIWNII